VKKLLKSVVIGITTVPKSFSMHPKLKKFLEKRKELAEKDFDVDWAYAESLAFGSLLHEGTPVRLSGQDSVRGTFSQRHLAFMDIKHGRRVFPDEFYVRKTGSA
jgi:2-oxoglutarate dehydrogenase complex dehydrogenase (E1) component-like enzyme